MIVFFKRFSLFLFLFTATVSSFSQVKKVYTSKTHKKNVTIYTNTYMNLNDKELKSACINKFDTVSFNALGIFDNEYFSYALYYANKYDYHTACISVFNCVYDIFWQLNGEWNCKINKKFYQPIVINKECFNFINDYLIHGVQGSSTSYLSLYHELLSKMYFEGIYLSFDSIKSQEEYLKYGVCSEASLNKSKQYIQIAQNKYEKSCHEKYDGNKQQLLIDIANSSILKIAAFGNITYYEELKAKINYKEFMLYSFIMAYNYNYKPAYNDFANELEQFYAEIKSPINDKVSDIIKYCLDKGNVKKY